jgi:putative nucleotidyltransferase with HDIG domain
MSPNEAPRGPAAARTIRQLTDATTAARPPSVRTGPDTHDPLLVAESRWLAAGLLCVSAKRWQHTRAVARRAALAAGAVGPADRQLLVAAAWLHDIGYAPDARRTGFHPLDGALYLQEQDWPPTIVGLVAHHSGARFVARVWGLEQLMRTFDADVNARGPLADALTYADQTTGPDGRLVDVDERLAEMLRRHGPDSPNARVHAQRASAIRAAVHRTEQCLRRMPPEPRMGERAELGTPGLSARRAVPLRGGGGPIRRGA